MAAAQAAACTAVGASNADVNHVRVAGAKAASGSAIVVSINKIRWSGPLAFQCSLICALGPGMEFVVIFKHIGGNSPVGLESVVLTLTGIAKRLGACGLVLGA